MVKGYVTILPYLSNIQVAHLGMRFVGIVSYVKHRNTQTRMSILEVEDVKEASSSHTHRAKVIHIPTLSRKLIPNPIGIYIQCKRRQEFDTKINPKVCRVEALNLGIRAWT